MWQRVARGAGRFKVRNLIGHGFCCILFELALSLVSYRTATPCWRVPIRTKQLLQPCFVGFCRVVVSQSQLFHVVSALQFVLEWERSIMACPIEFSLCFLFFPNTFVFYGCSWVPKNSLISESSSLTEISVFSIFKLVSACYWGIIRVYVKFKEEKPFS